MFTGTPIAPIFYADYYKTGHGPQYPDGTTLVYSNFTPRSSRVEGSDHIVFFGLQYICKEYLIAQFNQNFFSQPKDKVCAEYKDLMDYTMGPGVVGIKHIEELHDLQYLPIRIKALKEGTRVPLQTPPVTICNTKPEFFWLTNYLETLLSMTLWKPCTSATTAEIFRKIFDDYAAETSDMPEFVGWQGHDFSMRGMSGLEDACMSGAAHLTQFTGTDTIPAVLFLEHYYGADRHKELIGGSVPATEHSVMCAGGKGDELQTLNRLLDMYPTGILSVVSDTWDLFKLVNEYLPALKDKIMARDGKLVIRPDSGIPNLILNGDPDSDCELERMGLIRLLDKHFGSTVNSKGYRQLDSHIGAIYGDGINGTKLREILKNMKGNGYASTNLVVGLGSYTYEYVTRDTYGTVCKATYVEVDGVARPIWKDPKTGAWKKSHKGLMRVNEDLTVTQDVSWAEEQGGMLETVFENGKMVRNETLAEIRKRVRQQ